MVYPPLVVRRATRDHLRSRPSEISRPPRVGKRKIPVTPLCMPYSHPTLQRAVLESHSRGSADAGSIPAASTFCSIKRVPEHVEPACMPARTRPAGSTLVLSPESSPVPGL